MFKAVIHTLVIVSLTLAIFFGGLSFVRSQYADKSCCRRKATEVTKPAANIPGYSILLVGMMDGRPEDPQGDFSDEFCDCPSSVRWGSCGHNLPFPFGE